MRQMNISIDDVSPHRLSGLDVIDRCYDVIRHFPDVKFTLFVPTAYWRTVVIPGRADTTTRRALFINEHPEFCRQLAKLPRSNFEVGYHGRFHGIPGRSNNDEFRSIDTSVCATLWHDMNLDVSNAGLTHVFKDIFRPPAMYMSPDALRFFAARDVTLALSPRQIHVSSYGDALVEVLDKVVFANVWIPDDRLDDVSCDEHIELLYHACSWDGGYFNSERVAELITWLGSNEVRHSFMDEMRGLSC